MTNIHCPMIHGGLQIDLKKSATDVWVNNCCLRTDFQSTTENNVWNSKSLIPLREINSNNQWDPGCWTCQGNELAGMESFRTGMLNKFGVRTNLSGPTRLDLMFDVGCNLACRICNAGSSTFWQRHLKENNIPFNGPLEGSRANDMIEILKKLDLSNLEMVVFCGGETLLGQGYWRVAEALAELAPSEQVTLCFQTNGTQPIDERNHKTIERFQLVKLNISLDGVGERFEYMRWPANWNQVVNNINHLRDTAPVNVMFLIEETISVFNLYYQAELAQWAQHNFNSNRLGDVTNHTRHVAEGIFSLKNLSQEYVDAIANSEIGNLIHPKWQENPESIRHMLQEIDCFDLIRNQDWRKTFPEVAELYSKYL